MSICKIGETKVICGRRYVKSSAASESCIGCDFDKDNGCLIWDFGHVDSRKSIDEGGRECENSIWILADDQPEAPTATPSNLTLLRDEVREQRRFEAAVAAMQGMLDVNHVQELTPEGIASWSVRYADAILAELDRTGAGK